MYESVAGCDACLQVASAAAAHRHIYRHNHSLMNVADKDSNEQKEYLELGPLAAAHHAHHTTLPQSSEGTCTRSCRFHCTGNASIIVHDPPRTK